MKYKFKGTLEDDNKHYAPKISKAEILFGILFSIAAVYCFVVIFFSTVFLQIRVVGMSMQPTYNELLTATENEETSIYRDYVVVNRLNEGNDGDIVIIKSFDNNIIKRLIAKGGETVVLKKDNTDEYFHFYVNGVKVDESYLGNHYLDMDDAYFHKFTKLDGAVIGTDQDGNLQASVVVPNEKIFVLGDNRKNSRDSLVYGFFSKTQIVGTVAFSFKYNENLFIGLFRAIFG